MEVVIQRYTVKYFKNVAVFDPLKPERMKIYTSPNLDLYGHSAVLYRNLIYIYGGIDGKNEKLRQILEISFENQLNCSQVLDVNTCEICPAGTYSDSIACINCPIARYNSKKGASSIHQCKLCPDGFFTEKLGSSYCNPCSEGFKCPYGSISQLPEFSISENETNENLNQDSSNTNLISISVLFILTCIIILLYYSYKSYRMWPIILSLLSYLNTLNYKNLHWSNINIRAIKQASFIFAIYIILPATLITTLYLLNYQSTSDLKTSIPSQVYHKKIISKSFTITSTFFVFGGKCLESIPTPNICSSTLSIQESGISYQFKSTFCTSYSQHCQIKIIYSNIEINSSSAYILITSLDPESYTRAISINITSSYSNPERFSGLSTLVESPYKDHIIKGLKPTEFFYKVIPNAIRRENYDDETGFEVYLNKNPVLGSLANDDE